MPLLMPFFITLFTAITLLMPQPLPCCFAYAMLLLRRYADAAAAFSIFIISPAFRATLLLMIFLLHFRFFAAIPSPDFTIFDAAAISPLFRRLCHADAAGAMMLLFFTLIR